MKLEKALAPQVGIDEFFQDHVPELFEARRELFAAASDTPVIVSVLLTDTGDRYTIEFRHDGCRVEKGEMIDFPVVTICGSTQDWQDVKRRTLRIAKPLEKRAHSYDPPRKLTRDFLKKLERHDGEFRFLVAGADRDEPIEMSLVLNDYDLPPGAPVITLSGSIETAEQLARGEIRPTDLDDKVRISGDVGLGLDVGGLLLEHFPELEG